MKKRLLHRKYQGIIICALILATVIILGFLKLKDQIVNVSNGSLDLQGWQEADGILQLNGQWDFYWKHFITNQEVEQKTILPDLKVSIPKVWNGYRIEGKRLTGFGYASYVLKVHNAVVGKSLVIRMPVTLTSYELSIDDTMLISSGKVGINKELCIPEAFTREAEFIPDKADFSIIIHVANFTYTEGGISYPIQMGYRKQMADMDKTLSDLDLFTIGALVIMAFYYLCIFIYDPSDRGSVSIAIACILLAGQTAISGDFLIYRLIPNISFIAIIKMDYFINCWFIVCTICIINLIYPEKLTSSLLKIIVPYAVVMTALILLIPINFGAYLFLAIQFVAILTVVYMFWVLAAAFIHKKKNAHIALFCGMLIMVFAAYDVIYHSNISRVGSLIYIFMLTYFLAFRYSESYHNVNELSQKLLKLDVIKDEFLAKTSHELRTPLNGILGMVEAMLRNNEGTLSSQQRANLSTVAASSRRLSNLVNDILDYSKMKYDEVKLDIKPLRIDGIIQTIVNVFSQLDVSKECEITFDGTDVPLVIGDESRITQILYNLIGNAVKFTVKGYVRISARKCDEVLEICISDTGDGIPEDKLEDIFKSFEQVDNSITRRYEGTGLGLYITKHLVELQGGHIWVESDLGKGSKFYFTLPLYTGENQQISGTYPEQVLYPEALLEDDTVIEHKSESKDGVWILLVDDDRINLRAASSLLKTKQYNVTLADNGRAALEVLKKKHKYSLIILDVMMPEMSGYEVCRKIREDKSNVELPVLMLTARNSIKDILLGFEAGANDYLLKPYEPEELFARVRTLVELQHSVRRAVDAEFAFLQAQIKPHFLFNTLNTISSYCDTNPELAAQLIDNYAGYLRETFDFKMIETIHPIEKELQLVRLYVDIEKARFGEDLNVIFDVDSTIQVGIPRLSIQPLVENAIQHGLRKKHGTGTVFIRVIRVAEGILISVEDDGQGIEQDQLVKLLTNEAGDGIGLWNINKRLRKQYGVDINIESIQNKGTRVFFIIKEEDGENQ